MTTESLRVRRVCGQARLSWSVKMTVATEYMQGLHKTQLHHTERCIPLPWVDSSLDALGGAKYFSMIDLAGGSQPPRQRKCCCHPSGPVQVLHDKLWVDRFPGNNSVLDGICTSRLTMAYIVPAMCTLMVSSFSVPPLKCTKLTTRSLHKPPKKLAWSWNPEMPTPNS